MKKSQDSLFDGFSRCIYKFNFALLIFYLKSEDNKRLQCLKEGQFSMLPDGNRIDLVTS